MAELNREYQDVIPDWTLRFTTKKRRVLGNKAMGNFFADYIRIRTRTNTRHNRKRTTKRFDIINLELFKSPVPKNAFEQLDMAIALLEMCDERGITFRSTRGSLGAAMLKASPHWNKGRRSALSFINQEARKYLPGNFYSTSHKIRKDFIKGEDRALNPTMDHVYLIDQISSHHTVASQIKLPDPEDIRARGPWKQALKGDPQPWCHPYSRVGQLIMSGKLPGLYLARVMVTHIGPSMKHLQLPFAQKKTGRQLVWLWTPDFRIIEQTFQIQIELFICGMAGFKQDEALKEYGEWALEEIARDPSKATYKKSTLLAAYGMLAFDVIDKPIHRFYGGINKGFMPIELPRAGLVKQTSVNYPKGIEPSIVNVINRGLIESETRARSLEYARELHMLGYHVPQIYADAILVETDSMPFVHKGWRILHSLEKVWIPRANAFMSNTICKLPGFARGDVDSQIWRERYEDAVRPIRAR